MADHPIENAGSHADYVTESDIERRDPSTGTPEAEMLRRIEASRRRSTIRSDQTLLRHMLMNERGERRDPGERQYPTLRHGYYDEQGRETMYLPSQQRVLDIQAELAERVVQETEDFLSAGQTFQLASERELQDRLRMYSESATAGTSPERRDALRTTLLPLAAEADLRRTDILYEEALINDFWEAEERYARYMVSHPDLRERLRRVIPEDTLREMPDIVKSLPGKVKELEVLEEEMKIMHQRIDQYLDASSAISQIWYYETMREEHSIASLISNLPVTLDVRTVHQDGEKRLLSLGDLRDDPSFAQTAGAIMTKIPPPLHAIPLAELRKGYRVLSEQLADSKLNIQPQELEDYIGLLRNIGVTRGYLREDERDADIKGLEAISDRMSGEFRTILRQGHAWKRISGEEGSQQVRPAPHAFTQLTEAHIQVTLAEVLEGGRGADLNSIFPSFDACIGEIGSFHRDSLMSAGSMYELLTKRGHFGAGTRPGGTVIPLDAREKQGYADRALPEPLRSSLVAEEARYGIAFGEYIDALDEVTRQQLSWKEQLREAILSMIDRVVDMIDETIIQLDSYAWFLPDHTGIGEANLGNLVRGTARNVFGAEWASLNIRELQSIKAELLRRKDETQSTMERYADTPAALAVERDRTILNGLRAIATPHEKKLHEKARTDLDAAIESGNDQEIAAASRRYREAQVGMGASPEGLALVTGNPQVPASVDLDALRSRYVDAKTLVEALEDKRMREGITPEIDAQILRAHEQLNSVQRDIQGAYERVLSDLIRVHLPALGKESSTMLDAIRQKFNNHAIRYAEYDYLKYVPLSIAAGWLTTAAETVAGTYYTVGWVPGGNKILPGSRTFRRAVNFVPRHAGRMAWRGTQTGLNSLRSSLSQPSAVAPSPQVTGARPPLLAPDTDGLSDAVDTALELLGEGNQSKAAEAAPRAQKLQEATKAARACKLVTNGLIAFEVYISLWLLIDNEREIAEAREAENLPAIDILQSRRRMLLLSGGANLSLLGLVGSLSKFAGPAGITWGGGLMAADTLYRRALEDSERLDEYRSRPSAQLFADISKSHEQQIVQRNPLTEVTVGFLNVNPFESMIRRRGDMIEAFVARNIEIPSTMNDVESAGRWFDALGDEEKKIVLARSGVRDAAIRTHVRDAILESRASIAVIRANEFIDLFTRDVRSPDRKTMDVGAKDPNRSAQILMMAQEIGSMYAFRDSLLNPNEPLRYELQPGQYRTVDLSKLPSPIPTSFRLPYERDKILNDIGDALKQYWNYRMYILRAECVVAQEKFGSAEALQLVRPRLMQHLAPSIACAEVSIAHQTRSLFWTENQRTKVLTGLRDFVEGKIVETVRQMADPRMDYATLIRNLENVAQEIRYVSAKALYNDSKNSDSSEAAS